MSMMRKRAGLISGLACWLAACGPSADSDRDRFEVVDSAGVQVVHNRYAGFDTTAVEMVEDLRIGVRDGDERYQFFRAFGFNVDSLGRILVANLGTSTIRVFDHDGRFVREIGAQGNGPGEFRSVTTPIVWGDTLGISDQTAMRFSVFDTSGTFLTSWPMLNAENRALYPVGASRDGWAIWMNQFGFGQRTHRPGDVTTDTTRVGRMPTSLLAQAAARGSAFTDSLIAGVFHWESAPTTWISTDEGVMGYSPMFGAGASWTVDGHGRFVLRTGPEYHIDFFGLDGRLERRVTRDFERVLVTDAMVEDHLKRVEASVREQPPVPFDRLGAARRHAAASRAEFLSPGGRIIVSNNGELWVDRVDIHGDAAHYVSVPGHTRSLFYYDVLDADGRYRFTGRMADRFSPRWVSGDTVRGGLRDEEDVEYVVRYRLDSRESS
jgi:hypothetical protein